MIELTQVHNTTPNKLIEAFDKKIDNRVSQLEKKLQLKENSDKWLTRKETADLLSVSLVCLHHWRKNGILPAYKLGTIVRYSLKEVNKKLEKI